MPGAVFLKGEKLNLRTIEREDLEKLQKMGNHPEMRKYSPGARPVNKKEQEKYFEEFLPVKEVDEKGLGTRVTELVLDYVFSEFPVNRVDASYRKGNRASGKMQRKLGFQEEARERDYIYLRGGYHDLLRTSLLRSEWKK